MASWINVTDGEECASAMTQKYEGAAASMVLGNGAKCDLLHITD